METMKNLKKYIAIGIFVAVGLLATGQVQAYFYQPHPRAYNPYSYNYGYSYGYGRYDTVTPMIQSHINFVSNFTYIPAPIHPYFFTHYYNPFRW